MLNLFIIKYRKKMNAEENRKKKINEKYKNVKRKVIYFQNRLKNKLKFIYNN